MLTRAQILLDKAGREHWPGLTGTQIEQVRMTPGVESVTGQTDWSVTNRLLPGRYRRRALSTARPYLSDAGLLLRGELPVFVRAALKKKGRRGPERRAFVPSDDVGLGFDAGVLRVH